MLHKILTYSSQTSLNFVFFLYALVTGVQGVESEAYFYLGVMGWISTDWVAPTTCFPILSYVLSNTDCNLTPSWSAGRELKHVEPQELFKNNIISQRCSGAESWTKITKRRKCDKIYRIRSFVVLQTSLKRLRASKHQGAPNEGYCCSCYTKGRCNGPKKWKQL